MLADVDSMATLPVNDMAVAKQFYGGTLGLSVVQEDDAGVLYKSGNSQVYVYQSDYAGTNQATAAGWSVQDFDNVVQDLQSKGVMFERYEEMEGVTLEGDVHVMETGEKAVWFKDPSGNILAVDNMEL